MVKVKKKKQNIKKMQPQDVPLIRLIQRGPQALSNIELLTILLGKDVNWGRHKTTYELAQEIFQKYDIKRLSQASIGELDKIFGIVKN
jgi:DNA repair protein RadC